MYSSSAHGCVNMLEAVIGRRLPWQIPIFPSGGVAVGLSCFKLMLVVSESAVLIFRSQKHSAETIPQRNCEYISQIIPKKLRVTYSIKCDFEGL